MSFTVYYVVGQPRTGSTFVGDRIARLQNVVNAGEVWQTFRSVGLVTQPGFDDSRAPWARREVRAEKNREIKADPFWSEVLLRAEHLQCYSALVQQASLDAQGLVDCSKTDIGIGYYLELGCEVVVVHSVRAFGSWAASMQKHAFRHGLPQQNSLRLLASYLRVNRAIRKLWMGQSYLAIAQEDLAKANTILAGLPAPQGIEGRYRNAEMFGTPGFSGTFDPARATVRVTRADRLFFRMIGIKR